MSDSHFRGLYELQDRVLDLVNGVSSLFYLSGGTALARYYLHHRHSDDLDFFTHETGLFSESFRMVLNSLDGWKHKTTEIELSVDARDFKRIELKEDDLLLKLDFVADATTRVGIPAFFGTHKVDTVRNILSNKLGALMGRDEPRDVFDVMAISRAYRFDWKAIVAEALMKEAFELEDLVFRLQSFPLHWLDPLPLSVSRDPGQDLDDMKVLCEDLWVLGGNSLAPHEAPVL